MSETIETLIYTGRRIMQTQKLGHGYLLQGASVEGEVYFSTPLTTGTKVGALIEATVTDGPDGTRSVFTKGLKKPQVIDHLPADDPRLLQWAALDQAAATEHGLSRESTRIAKSGEDPLVRQLAPVRQILAGMGDARRTATIAWILTYLLTGRR